MILYIEDPKDATRKLQEHINEFGKVEGSKSNTQKSVTFLYTNNESPEREMKKTIPFTITSKRRKLRLRITSVDEGVNKLELYYSVVGV